MVNSQSARRRRPRDRRWPHQLAIRLSDEVWDRLVAIADAEDRPVATLGREALERGLGATEKASAGRRGRPS